MSRYQPKRSNGEAKENKKSCSLPSSFCGRTRSHSTEVPTASKIDQSTRSRSSSANAPNPAKGNYLRRGHQSLELSENKTAPHAPSKRKSLLNASAADESLPHKSASTADARRRTRSGRFFDALQPEPNDSVSAKYGLEDILVKLKDDLECNAANTMWKYKLTWKGDKNGSVKSVLITATDSDSEPEFVINENGLGGTTVSSSGTVFKVKQQLSGKKRPSLSAAEDKQSGLAVKSPTKKRRREFLFRSRRGLKLSCTSAENFALSKKECSRRNDDTHNLDLLGKGVSTLRFTCDTSDEELVPGENAGRDENGMYEVERILARRKSETREFFDRERSLSVVMRREQRWSNSKKISQLHSLARWETEINNILRASGRQLLYIYNDVDCTRRRRDFTYITTNKFSAEIEAYVGNVVSVCSCETTECGDGENCCPAMEKSKFFYTKRRGIRSRYYGLSAESAIVECFGCQCSSDCPTKVLQNGRRYKVAIVRTKRCGWGVFALEEIPSNTFVVEYVGEVLTIAEADARADKTYQFELDGFGEMKYVLDAKYYGNEAAFINHSCDPNLKAVCVRVERFDQSFHRIGIFSTRRISRGQELTLNYFEGKLKSKQIITAEEGTTECFCGTSNCMGYWPRWDNDNVDCRSNGREQRK